MTTPVKLSELVSACEWVSAAGPFENEAYVNRESGTTHWSSSMNELDEELPEDIEDGTQYIAVPHKKDLDLGRSLALQFVEERLPSSYEVVNDYFHKRGAYARFKDLLDRKGLLNEWHQHEEKATEQALREWAQENGFHVVS